MYKLFLEEGKKALVRWMFVLFAIATAFLFTPLWENGQQVWNSPKVLTEIQSDIRGIKDDITKLSGEDRVIRMDSALSYVEEPYRLGSNAPVRVHLVIGRTLLGSTCRLTSRTAIYTDEMGISSASTPVAPSRQIGTSQERVVLDLKPPRSLKAGRTVLTLELIFDCGGSISVIDRTDPLVFMVVEDD
jgi:hypothetical protein